MLADVKCLTSLKLQDQFQLKHTFQLRGMASTGYTMLMSPNKGETAVHGCHRSGDMVVRMR